MCMNKEIESLNNKFILDLHEGTCLAKAKQVLTQLKKVGTKALKRKQRIFVSHSMYKSIEIMAAEARKKQEHGKAGHMFMLAANWRKWHADMFFNGHMDPGHLQMYNNLLSAVKKDLKKARQRQAKLVGPRIR